MLAFYLGMVLLAAATSAPPLAVDPNRELKVNMQFDAASFAASDLDKNGVLSLAEFQRSIDTQLDAAIAANPAAQTKIKISDREKMRSAFAASFRSFDLNSDGGVTWPEMASFMGLKTAQIRTPPK